MTIHRDSTIDLVKVVIDKNACTTKVVTEACRFVPELDIPDDEQVDVQIQKLAFEVHDIRIELAKVQFDLNLKIVEL